MRDGLPLVGLAMVLVAYGALFSAGGTDPLILALCLCAVLACIFHGTLVIPQRLLLPLTLPSLLVMLYQPEISPLTSSFPGPGSFRVASLVGTYLLILVVRKKDFNGKLFMAAGSVTLLIASGMRNDGDVPYGILCALMTVFLGLYLRQIRGPWARRNVLPGILAFVPVLLLAGTIALLARWSETRLGMFMSFFNPPTPVAMQFASRSQLDGMQRSAGQDKLVARLFSQAPPTYLTARSYAIYTREEVWDSLPGPSVTLPMSDLRVSGQPTFELTAPRQLLQKDRVELVTAAGGQLMATRDAFVLAAPLRKLERAASGGLYFKGAVDFPGTFWLGRGGLPDPDPQPEPVFIEVPDNLPAIVRRTAHEVTRGAPTPRAKAEAVEAFLQTQFTYGFGYPFRRGSPLLEQFLENRPPAHCEFFATAMVMMLRTQKVPARYVVGFIVDSTDYNDLGGFYCLRAHHAHAWVEVYLEGAGWVTYDPTPPDSRLPQRSWLQRLLNQAGDLISYGFKRVRDFFRLSPAEMLRSALAFVSHPAVLVTLVGLIAGFYLLRLRPSWRKERLPRKRRDEGRLGVLLARFESRLKKHQLERPEHWTLLEWSRKLEHDELAEPARQFLETYCRARYGAMQAEDELERLLEQIEKIRPTARRKSGLDS